jgi:RNA polymerase sigma-70 factor (ECF subfamily)
MNPMASEESPRIERSRREEMRFGAKEREYVFAVAIKYVKDREEAADVAQDAMVLAWRYRNNFRGDSQFSTWLYRIAATTALMHLRKKRRQPINLTVLQGGRDASDERDFLAERPSGGPSPEDHVIARQEVARAHQQLDEMGDKYGKIFMMRFADGYSETEVAREMKMNVGTVKTRAYRARAAVREKLASNA